jgi:enoyl-[acyl-carrier-protein] reductase (NADH)
MILQIITNKVFNKVCWLLGKSVLNLSKSETKSCCWVFTHSQQLFSRFYSFCPVIRCKQSSEVINAVNQVVSHFGGIDILINNAGYGLFGTVEETTEQQARDQMETNFFGLLWVTQAVLPIMRQQKVDILFKYPAFWDLLLCLC